MAGYLRGRYGPGQDYGEEVYCVFSDNELLEVTHPMVENLGTNKNVMLFYGSKRAYEEIKQNLCFSLFESLRADIINKHGQVDFY